MANRFAQVAKKESENLVGENQEILEATKGNNEIVVTKEELLIEQTKNQNEVIINEVAFTFGKDKIKDSKKPKNLYLKQTTIDIIETCGDRKKYNYYEGEIVDMAIEMWYKSLGLDIVKDV